MSKYKTISDNLIEQLIQVIPDILIIFDTSLNIIKSNKDILSNNKTLHTLLSEQDLLIIKGFVNGEKNTPNEFITSTKITEGYSKVILANLEEYNHCFLILIQDITSEYELNSNLCMDKIFLDNLLNQIPDSIYFKDINSRFLKINKTQAQTIGVQKGEDAIGKTDMDFFLMDHAVDAFEDEKSLINNKKEIIKKDELIKNAKGEFQWVSTIKAPLMDNKKIIGTFGITRDITDSKAIELQLKSSNTLFNAIWNYSPNGMRVLDSSGKIFMVNPAFCLMFGLGKEELIGKEISIMFHESIDEIKNNKVRSKKLSDLAKNIRTKNIKSSFEKKLHLWNDTHIWFEVLNSCLEINDDVYLLSIFKDIDDRKIAEEKLEYSEALNKTTIDALSDFLIVVDSNQQVILANNTFKSFFRQLKTGLGIEELTIDGLVKILPFLKLSFFDVIFKEKKEIIIFDEFNSNDKQYFFEVKFIPVLADNSVKRIIVLLLDISDLKNYENQLRRSALIFENMNEAVFIFNKQGIIVDINSAAELLYGFKRGYLIGNTIDCLSNNGLVLKDKDKVFKTLLSSKTANYKMWYNHPISSTKIHIDIDFLPLTDNSGAIIAFYTIARDITELTKANEKIGDFISELQTQTKELEKYSEELKLSNTSKDRFFSIIAHDLKSPFQGILGFCNILKDEYETLNNEDIHYMVRNISDSAQNLYDLIENLLEWSRLQLGKIEYTPEDFNLDLVLYSVKNMLNGNALKKNISIVIESEQNFIVNADNNMINSIISNLLSNAIKFTKKNGLIKIVSKRQKNFVAVSIIDNGIGIDRKMLQQLFKIDINISRNGTENEKGTGLGLILCKDFIERNGGTIKVKSKVNTGSTFTITIPLSKKKSNI